MLSEGQLVASELNPHCLRPPLKWAGGKRWLVPHVLQIWETQAERRLVEPFVGGLAMTLGLEPREALLNDSNPHLISFYNNLQVGLRLDSLKVPFVNEAEIFYKNRNRFNDLIAKNMAHTSEAAGLFYYLNRTCFNGLCRFNASGFFNVPFGRYKTIPYRYDFTDYSALLAAYEFQTGDFENLRIADSDFLYADPPYDVEFTSYSAGGFSWDDQVRLAQWLSLHRGPVVVSNQATARILKLYRAKGFKVRTLPAPRRISCDGNRDDAMEMLAVKGL